MKQIEKIYFLHMRTL